MSYPVVCRHEHEPNTSRIRGQPGVTPNCNLKSPIIDNTMSAFQEDHEHLSDPLDIAAQQSERLLQAQLEYRRPSGPAATGFCLDPLCGEQLVSDEVLAAIEAGAPVPPGTPRWCGTCCRDGYERSQPPAIMPAYA